MGSDDVACGGLAKAIEKHVPAIWRFALSLSGRPDMADDLTQSTCLRALERSHQFQPGGNLRGWVLSICRSIWLNEVRSMAIRKTGSLDGATEADLIDLAPSQETNIFARQVFQHVMELPEAQRSAVELVFVQQMTYREAAEVLGVPIGTIMSRLATARRKLASLNQPVPNRLGRSMNDGGLRA